MRKKHAQYSLLALSVAVASIAAWHWQAEAVVRPSGVVVRRTLASTVAAQGAVQPSATVELKARITGTVVEVLVGEGDEVSRGMPLARIQPTDLQPRLDAAAARVAEASQEFSMSQLDLDDAAVLVQERDTARRERLFAAGLVSEEDVDQAKYRLVHARRAFQVKSAVLPVREAALRQAKAELERLDAEAAHTTPRSPIQAQVMRRHAVPGAPVRSDDGLGDGTTLFSLAVGPPMAEANVPSQFFGRILPGMAARVSLDRRRSWVPGKVVSTAHAADTSSGKSTFVVRVGFDSPPGPVLWGAQLDVEITIETLIDALAVPEFCLRSEGGSGFYVVREEAATLKRVTVVPRLSTGSFVAVTGALDAGDRLVECGE